MISLFSLTHWFKRPAVIIEINDVGVANEPAPMPSIVLIHGANQTNLTFAHLRHSLPAFHYINIDYSSKGGFYNNLAKMVEMIKDQGPVYIIGHSLGGVYATHLAQQINCIGGATVATPFGGSKTADWARYFAPSYQIFKEVGQKSAPVIEARNFQLPGRWTNFVSTEGNVPWHGGENDGVLTIDSMTARKDIFTKYIKSTHYEIILNSTFINSVSKNFLRAAEKLK